MSTTPDFSPSPWSPLVDARLPKVMDALLVTLQVQGGVIANWHDAERHAKSMEARDRKSHEAMNDARSKVRR